MIVAKIPRLNKCSFTRQIRLSFFFVRNLSGILEKGQYWDYSPSYGPSQWNKTWKIGQRQSPVDICTKSTIFDPTLKSFILDKSPIQFKATNMGNNVSMTGSEEITKLDLKGGPLNGTYQFGEMHMHWGEMNICGCEHTVDGKRYAGELHLVHWNQKYEEMSEAVDKSDGLAVLGIFLDAQDHHSCHPDLDLILQMFDRVHEQGCTVNCDDKLSPYSLLPLNAEAYFTYLGSLTTPPLFESVTWTVFVEALKISIKQWERLNTVLTSPNKDGEDRFCKQCAKPNVISNNYRPIQPLYERTIRASVEMIK